MHQVVERRPTTLSSADALVDVLVGAAEALASISAEVSQLEVTVLVQSADASVKRNRVRGSHSSPSSPFAMSSENVEALPLKPVQARLYERGRV